MDLQETRTQNFRTDLIIKYGKQVDPEILLQYSPEDLHLNLHEDDSVLQAISINLPKAPGAHLVKGFGLPANQQKFCKEEIPEALVEMPLIVKKRTGSDSIDDIWVFLYDNQVEFKKEIEFIRKCWYHRLYGYWCMINGKPTFLDGWHWLYCNTWELDIGLPEYRSRDRKFFIAARYFSTTTEAVYQFMVEAYDDRRGKVRPYFFPTERYAKKFADQSQKKSGIAHEVRQGYFIVDFGKRTVVGFIYPKHRREGATYKAGLIGWEVSSRTLKARFGHQSMDETTCKGTYLDNIVKPWQQVWWWFKPVYRGSNTHLQGIDFQREHGKVGRAGAGIVTDMGLQSFIEYATTQDGKYFDGKKLVVYHDDEVAKLDREDCYRRNQVTMNCISQGNRSVINGFTIKTSTVGEFTRGGGANFKRLCQGSFFNQRNPNGQTETGNVVVFIPAYDGLEGFIDEFGESVINTPTPEQARFIGRDIGAKEYLENQIADMKLREDDPKVREALLEFLRLHPTDFKQLFLQGGTGNGFNVLLLSERLAELAWERPQMRVGNFIRDRTTNRSAFEETADGRFIVSYLLPPHLANRFRFDQNLQKYRPNNWKKFVASADPFKFNTTEHNRMSMGAGTVFLRRDEVLDGDNLSLKEWSTHRFICTYKNRPNTKDEYAEDMLAMTLYHGCFMSPEINVDTVWDYFLREGFAGMLWHFYNPVTRTFSKNPGFNSLTGTKNAIFTYWRDYIQSHSHKEEHEELLQEASNIPGQEAMTDYDLFTAAGGCLITDENMRGAPDEVLNYGTESNSATIDLNDYF